MLRTPSTLFRLAAAFSQGGTGRVIAVAGSERVASPGRNAGDNHQAADRLASGPTEQRRQGFAADAASQERQEAESGDEAAYGEIQIAFCGCIMLLFCGAEGWVMSSDLLTA